MSVVSSMSYVRLGKSGLITSRLWLGAMSFGNPGGRPWVLNAPDSARLIARALEKGINTIDTGDVYSGGRSEEIVGETVNAIGRRDRLVLCTKFGWPMSADADVNARGYSRKHIIQACEASLRRLRTDYIDLYQTHIWDPTTRIEEMVEAFDRLVESGKVLYAGAADMPTHHLAKSLYTARLRGSSEFISMQFHYSAVWREAERELMPCCREEGLGLVAYSPLARGFLCGVDRKTRRTETDDRIGAWYGRPSDRRVAEKIAAIGNERGVSSAAIALAWVLARPGVTAAAIGPTDVEQLDGLCSVLNFRLDPAEVALIDELYELRPASGHG